MQYDMWSIWRLSVCYFMCDVITGDIDYICVADDKKNVNIEKKYVSVQYNAIGSYTYNVLYVYIHKHVYMCVCVFIYV